MQVCPARVQLAKGDTRYPPVPTFDKQLLETMLQATHQCVLCDLKMPLHPGQNVKMVLAFHMAICPRVLQLAEAYEQACNQVDQINQFTEQVEGYQLYLTQNVSNADT